MVDGKKWLNETRPYLPSTIYRLQYSLHAANNASAFFLASAASFTSPAASSASA